MFFRAQKDKNSFQKIIKIVTLFLEKNKKELVDNKIIDYKELYKNYLRINNMNTVYLYYYSYFEVFMNKNEFDIITNINYTNLCKYIMYLQDRKYKTTYINNIIKAIRCFYKCLIINDLIDDKIMEELMKVKLFKIDIRIPTYITLEELDDILEMGMSFCEFIHPVKLKTVLCFLFFTGVRKMEFVNLKREDINILEKYATIRIPTKNKNERVVYFTKRVAALLVEYFALEQEKINAFNMTASQLTYLVKSIKDFVPNKKKISLHTFRHSFAIMLARNLIDSRVAQKLLGHKSIHSTLLYYNPDAEVVREIYHKKIK